MDLGPGARPIGEILRPQLAAIGEAARALGTAFPLNERMPELFPGDEIVVLHADEPGSLVMNEQTVLRILRASGWDARRRGAEISVIHHGLLVKKGSKSELVRYDQVECNVLARALDRVAPIEAPE
jgi:hypothetical protein